MTHVNAPLIVDGRTGPRLLSRAILNSSFKAAAVLASGCPELWSTVGSWSGFDTPYLLSLDTMVFTAPLSRNQPPADRSPILNPNPTTPPPAKFANIYGGSSVAAVLISGYLWRRLIRPLIRHGPRSLHYSTGR